ncbi:hypothetical protein F5884DRAFT_905679 [Xylogone sp. PMI_703]|nr:hypothetical protein F5884DRAFT_905679 [Xylogone sp. PMI_703]
MARSVQSKQEKYFWVGTKSPILERLRCATCKRFQPITAYPFRKDGFHTTSCHACHIRLKDRYLERKGQPNMVSEEGKARQRQRIIRESKKASKAQQAQFAQLCWNQSKRIEYRSLYIKSIDQGKRAWEKRQSTLEHWHWPEWDGEADNSRLSRWEVVERYIGQGGLEEVIQKLIKLEEPEPGGPEPEVEPGEHTGEYTEEPIG